MTAHKVRKHGNLWHGSEPRPKGGKCPVSKGPGNVWRTRKLSEEKTSLRVSKFRFLQCPEELMSCLTKIMTHWHFWIFSVSLLLILRSNFIIFITFFSSSRYVPQLGFFFLLIITAPIIYNSSATFFFNAFGSPYQFSTYSEMLNYLDYYFSLFSHSLYAVSFLIAAFIFT